MSPKHGLTFPLLFAVALTLSACADSGDEASTGESGMSESTPPPAGSPPAGSPPASLPGSGESSEDSSALMAEYQEIQQRIGQIEQQAMADSALQEQLVALQAHIQEEMVQEDPEFGEKEERLVELQQEMSEAQQSGDQEAMSSIAAEGQALDTTLRQLQAEVLANEEIASKVTAFQENVQTKMAEIDPEAPQLIERASEIAAILQGGAMPGQPGGSDPSQGG